VLGILVDAVDYGAATRRIIDAACERRRYTVTALAVHGLMTGVRDPELRYRLNRFDMVTPDGQPVRWAMNLLDSCGLTDRVYGPTLVLRVCEEAARLGLPVYLYGSRQPVLDLLGVQLRRRFPGLVVAGAEPSRFRTTTETEKRELVGRIKGSGARLTFVGLGCPRQEVFAYEYGDVLSMPVLAVGAAFDYHAGTLAEPPELLQRWGLQWAYRLAQDPKRLWRRYLILNPLYLALLGAQAAGIWRPRPTGGRPPAAEVRYG
jgi:N-acetylglucosaminyldiphosphoundecaprenol N-acetyl-beta-D-mannosaminyltransferase